MRELTYRSLFVAVTAFLCGTTSAVAATPTWAGCSAQNQILARSIIGYETSASTSSDQAQQLFINFNGAMPLSKLVRLTGDLRLTGTPQQISASVNDFALNFDNNIGATKVNDLVRSIDFLIGGEFCVTH